MNKGKMVFAQLIEFASDDIFKGCVKRYNGDYNNKGPRLARVRQRRINLGRMPYHRSFLTSKSCFPCK
jgi:hypothetical protein